MKKINKNQAKIIFYVFTYPYFPDIFQIDKYLTSLNIKRVKCEVIKKNIQKVVIFFFIIRGGALIYHPLSIAFIPARI